MNNTKRTTPVEFVSESKNCQQVLIINPFFHKISVCDLIHSALNISDTKYFLYVPINGKHFLVDYQFASGIFVRGGTLIDLYIVKQIYYAEIKSKSNFLVVNEDGSWQLQDKLTNQDSSKKYIPIDHAPDAIINAIAVVLGDFIRQS